MGLATGVLIGVAFAIAWKVVEGALAERREGCRCPVCRRQP